MITLYLETSLLLFRSEVDGKGTGFHHQKDRSVAGGTTVPKAVSSRSGILEDLGVSESPNGKRLKYF